MKFHVVAALALMPVAVLVAQETRGTISGSVTDSTGAAVRQGKSPHH